MIGHGSVANGETTIESQENIQYVIEIKRLISFDVTHVSKTLQIYSL